MQFLPSNLRQQPAYEPALSNLLGSLGSAGTQLGTAFFNAKNRRELEKKEKEEKETERNNQAQAYSSMFGISHEQGRALATAPIDIQKTMVQQMIERGGFGRAQPQGAMPGQQLAALQELQPRPAAQQEIPYGGMTMSQMGQSLRPEDPGAFLAQRMLQGAAQPKESPVMATKPSSVAQKPAAAMKALDNEIAQAIRTYDIDQGMDMNPTNISGLLASGMNKAEAGQALKDTSEYFRTLSKQGHSAVEDNRRLMRMEQLIDKNLKAGGAVLRGSTRQALLNAAEDWKSHAATGSLGAALGGILGTILLPGMGTAAGVSLGTALGTAVGGALGGGAPMAYAAYERGNATPETQEFEKLSAEFVRGAKDVFGARITDADLNAFMKMVPTLANTDAGKMAIIRNLRLTNEGLIAKKKIADQVIKANGGRKPYNLEEMVESIAQPILDKYAQEFIQGGKSLMKQSGSAPAMQNPREFNANAY